MADIDQRPDPSRRRVVLAGLGGLAGVALGACGRGGSSPTASPTTPAPEPSSAPTSAQLPGSTAAAGAATTLAPTPECADADDLTPAQTEGPFFKPSSPERTDIRGSAAGPRLRLTGLVVTTGCKPVGRALVDFWQADAAGAYDNSGFTLRGHQFTDPSGRYVLDTVVPGLYPGRTRHIHVKVQAPGGRILTTQLYFPGEARNASDGIYRKECEMAVTDAAGGGRDGTFTFVLAMA